jgi:hypothetical protein
MLRRDLRHCRFYTKYSQLNGNNHSSQNTRLAKHFVNTVVKMIFSVRSILNISNLTFLTSGPESSPSSISRLGEADFQSSAPKPSSSPTPRATSCQTALKHSPRSIITPYVHRSEHHMKVPRPSDLAGSLTPRLSVGRCATAEPSVMRSMPPAEDEGECIVLRRD